jgi:hypothetical protein
VRQGRAGGVVGWAGDSPKQREVSEGQVRQGRAGGVVGWAGDSPKQREVSEGQTALRGLDREDST